MGRRKIEIERIVDKHDRFICFSKRRKGLFKKANALASQGFHIIILVFSKSGNAFVYGNQNEIIKRFLNNSDATNGAGSSNAVENLINGTSETEERTENLLNETSETVERTTEENNTYTSSERSVDSASEHSVDSAEQTEENDTLRSETGEISKESDMTRTVASEDSWNSLNSTLTESKHFWWNSSVENLSWKNLLQFKSAMEDLLSRVRTKANSLLVEQNFLSGFT